ncbi:MAG: hypothetical protein K5872_22320 [Rhizobiaceae bacterium]|nr:hypothetical protein [Rhizobiaceae bacterium]MCV0408957.1 hypothetical protein [Rhizobiaceae bacterium]
MWRLYDDAPFSLGAMVCRESGGFDSQGGHGAGTPGGGPGSGGGAGGGSSGGGGGLGGFGGFGGQGGLSGRGGGKGDTGFDAASTAGSSGVSNDAGPNAGLGGQGFGPSGGGFGLGVGFAATPATAPVPTSRPATTVAPKTTIAPKTTVAVPTLAPVPTTTKAPVAPTTTVAQPVAHTTTVAPVAPTTTTLSPVAQTSTTVSPTAQAPTSLSPVAQEATTVSPVDHAGTSMAAAYGQAAATMGQAGIGSVGGKSTASQGPSSSSPAGGSRGASGTSPGTSAPSGYGQAAASMGAADVGSVGGKSAAGGPSASSPAGGAQAAGGFDTGGRGLGIGGGRGPDASSPAGGAQAAGGFTDGSRGPGPGASPSPAAGAQAAAGYADGSRSNTTSMGLGRGFAGPASQRSAEDQSMATHNAIQSFLGKVRAAEARKDDPYNSLVYGRPGFNTPTHANLTDMTIAEVMSLQKSMVRNGHASTAVGAYQTISSTLSKAVEDLGIDPETTTFSPHVQDQIALSLADSRYAQASRNSATGVPSAAEFADALSQEWAGFANETGVSSYAGIAGNQANTSFSDVSSIAQGLMDTGAVGRGTTTGTPAGTASTPTNAPTPTGRPDTTPATAPTPTSRPDMTTTQSFTHTFAANYLSPRGIASTAIDIGLSSLPGPIGIGVGLANAGLSIAGRNTIGQSMVDSFMSGQTPDVDNDASNYGGGASEEDRLAAGKPNTDATYRQPSERFIETYIAPRWTDESNRRLPTEIWGDPSRYARREYAAA